MPAQVRSYISGGAIERYRFVKPNGTLNQVVQASAAADGPPCGISGGDSFVPPGLAQFYTGTDNTQAATASGQMVTVHGPTETCLLEMGASCAINALLTSDANGRGVVATASAVGWIGAKSMDNASASGVRIMVEVMPGTDSRGVI